MAISPTLRTIGSVFVGAMTFRLVRYEIAEESMAPALNPGDWVVGVRRPRRARLGDVVVFEAEPGFDVVKRIAPAPPGVELLWLLGDNPEAGSVDSRGFGPIPADRLAARLLVRYRPRPIRAIPPRTAP